MFPCVPSTFVYAVTFVTDRFIAVCWRREAAHPQLGQ